MTMLFLLSSRRDSSTKTSSSTSSSFFVVVAAASAAATPGDNDGITTTQQQDLFYPEDHFTYSTKIHNQQQLNDLIRSETFVAGKTLFVRYIASPK